MPDSNILIGPRGSNYIGKQTTFGTRVPPTREFYAAGLGYVETKPRYVPPTNSVGHIAGQSVKPKQIAHGATITWPTPLDANALLPVLESCLGAGVVSTPSSPQQAVNTRRHLWDRSPAAGVSPELFTFQIVDRDGAVSQGVRRIEVADALCTGFTIAAAANQQLTLSSDWLANKPNVAPAPPTSPAILDYNILVEPNVSVTIDDSWADMVGATPTPAADVFGSNIALVSGVTPMPRHNGSFDYDRAIVGPNAMINMTLDVRSTASGWVAERNHQAAEDLRFVMVTIEGEAAIETVSAHAFNFRVRIGGAFRHTDASLPDRGTEGEGGALNTQLILTSARDATADRSLYVEVQTDREDYI